jgi:catechol 2,3-dioxygenase-like lactoylglutathione lyase family enzyme
MTEVIGIDHIYITVSDVVASERFYDRVLDVVLGFRQNEFVIGGDRHIQYFNRHFGFVLRPARVHADHEPYAGGLHHFWFRVDAKADVQACGGRFAHARNRCDGGQAPSAIRAGLHGNVLRRSRRRVGELRERSQQQRVCSRREGPIPMARIAMMTSDNPGRLCAR